MSAADDVLLTESIGQVLRRQARDNGERRAVVGASVVTRGEPVDPAELESFLAGRLAHFKIPRVWRLVDGLPMTAAGKIRRTQVKEDMNTPVDSKERRSADGRDAR